MSDFKMSDVFDLPVWFKDKGKVRDASGTLVCGSAIAKVHTSTAINSHDKLTEQNKMLRGFIKSLNLSGTDDIRRMILLEDNK